MAQHAPKNPAKKIEIPKAPEDGKDYFHGTIYAFSDLVVIFVHVCFCDANPNVTHSGTTPE